MLGTNHSLYHAQVINTVIQVKLFVMFANQDQATYVAYIKNIGSDTINDALFTVTSKQPMKAFDIYWTVKGHTATSNIGSLEPGQEHAGGIIIIGNSSSATLVTTTDPPLVDPSSGIAKASYQQSSAGLLGRPLVINTNTMLNYARKLD